MYNLIQMKGFYKMAIKLATMSILTVNEVNHSETKVDVYHTVSIIFAGCGLWTESIKWLKRADWICGFLKHWKPHSEISSVLSCIEWFRGDLNASKKWAENCQSDEYDTNLSALLYSCITQLTCGVVDQVSEILLV